MEKDTVRSAEADEEEDAATTNKESPHEGIVAYDALDDSPASTAGTDGE